MHHNRVLLCRLRSEIDKLLSSDRILSLVVAIETALADERYEVRRMCIPYQPLHTLCAQFHSLCRSHGSTVHSLPCVHGCRCSIVTLIGQAEQSDAAASSPSVDATDAAIFLFLASSFRLPAMILPCAGGGEAEGRAALDPGGSPTVGAGGSAGSMTARQPPLRTAQLTALSARLLGKPAFRSAFQFGTSDCRAAPPARCPLDGPSAMRPSTNGPRASQGACVLLCVSKEGGNASSIRSNSPRVMPLCVCDTVAPFCILCSAFR